MTTDELRAKLREVLADALVLPAVDIPDQAIDQIDALYQEQMHQMSLEHARWWAWKIKTDNDTPLLTLVARFSRWLDGFEPEEKE